MVKISVNYRKLFLTYVGLFFISNGNYISTYFSSFQFFEPLLTFCTFYYIKNVLNNQLCQSYYRFQRIRYWFYILMQLY